MSLATDTQACVLLLGDSITQFSNVPDGLGTRMNGTCCPGRTSHPMLLPPPKQLTLPSCSAIRPTAERFVRLLDVKVRPPVACQLQKTLHPSV